MTAASNLTRISSSAASARSFSTARTRFSRAITRARKIGLASEQAIASSEAADDKENKAAAAARAEKRRANRGALPAHLPRIHVTIEPEDRNCPCCCSPMHAIGADLSERRPPALGRTGLDQASRTFDRTASAATDATDGAGGRSATAPHPAPRWRRPVRRAPRPDALATRRFWSKTDSRHRSRPTENQIRARLGREINP